MNAESGRRAAAPLVAVGIAVLAGLTFSGRDAGAAESGYAGRTETGCGDIACHGARSEQVEVQLQVPPSLLAAGDSRLLQVTVQSDLAGDGGGFNLGVSSGTLSVPASETGVMMIGAEASHNRQGAGRRSWAVAWRPDLPVHGCVVDFHVAGSATDRDRTERGDRWTTRHVRLEAGAGDDTGPPEEPVFAEPAAGSVVVSGNSFATPLPGTLVIGATRIVVETDDDLGLRSVTVDDEDLTGNPTPLGEARFEAGVGWVLQWDTLGITPGPHTLRARATDCAGNVVESTLEVLAL